MSKGGVDVTGVDAVLWADPTKVLKPMSRTHAHRPRWISIADRHDSAESPHQDRPFEQGFSGSHERVELIEVNAAKVRQLIAEASGGLDYRQCAVQSAYCEAMTQHTLEMTQLT